MRLRLISGLHYIDEPAFKRLSNLLSKARGKHFTGIAIYNALNQFLDWYINYSNTELTGKTFTQKDVANHLFVREIISDTQFEKYLLHSLFAAKEYAQALKQSMKKVNAKNYYEIALDVLSDYERLVCAYETHCKNTNPPVKPHWGKSDVLPMQELIWGAQQIMFAETTSSMTHFNYHDVRPIVSFQIRQIVEIMGRRIIGYQKIKKHSNGREALNMTQVAWKFLKELEDQGSLSNYISTIPLPPSTIRQINEWSNDFVHRAYIDTCYTRYFALSCVYTMMALPANPIRCYNGHSHLSLEYGNIQIHNYNSLKIEFENYLNPRRRIYDVEWMDIDKVGAYIITL